MSPKADGGSADQQIRLLSAPFQLFRGSSCHIIRVFSMFYWQ